MVGDDQVFSQQTFLLVKVGKSTAVADKMNNFSVLSKRSCDSEPACTARQQKGKQWNWIQLSLILLMCFYCCDTCLQKKPVVSTSGFPSNSPLEVLVSTEEDLNTPSLSLVEVIFVWIVLEGPRGSSYNFRIKCPALCCSCRFSFQ